jgi:hypothetical protein
MPDRSTAVEEQTVVDELYGLRPDQFTAARTQCPAWARQSGDRALAAQMRHPGVGVALEAEASCGLAP